MTGSENKKVLTQCPICKQNFNVFINPKTITEATRFPIPFVVAHNHRTIVVYIDANFHVRGAEPVFNLMGEEMVKKMQNKEDEEKSDTILLDNLSIEERTIYCCHSTCEEFQKSNIPNVLDKQIIALISKNKEINLASMLSNLTALGKALNRRIDEKTILRILDKYLKKGLIARHVMKTDEEFKSLTPFSSEQSQEGEL